MNPTCACTETTKRAQGSASESFLWVNKTRDSSILTRSESQEASAIRKHVHIQRRQIKAKKASAFAATSLSHKLRLCDGTLPFGHCPSSTAKDASIVHQPPGGPVKAEEGVIRDSNRSGPQVHLTTDGNLILTNPFGVYPSQYIINTQMAMKWFLLFFSPDVILIIEGRFVANLMLPTLLPLAFRDIDLFEALILWSMTFRRQAGDDETNRHAILWYRYRCLHSLQKRVSARSKVSSSDETMIIILFLANIAGREGRKAEAEAHHHGLRLMMATRRGLDQGAFSLGNGQLLRLTGNANTRTLSDTSPHGDRYTNFLDYPTHPFDPHLCAIITMLPPAPADLALAGKLSVETILVLTHAQRWATAQNIDIALAGDYGTPPELPELEEIRDSAILHGEGLRLITLFTTCLRYARTEHRPLSSNPSSPHSLQVLRENGRSATREQEVAYHQLFSWSRAIGTTPEEGDRLIHKVTQVLAEVIGLGVWHGQSSPRKKAIQQHISKQDLLEVWNVVWSEP